VSREADGVVALGDPPVVEVAGSPVTAPGVLRLARALTVIMPGADGAEGLAAPPTLSWGDHPSEARFEVDVLNAAGLTVMTRAEPAHDGSSAAVPFDVPFVAGQIYRFRARAFDAGGALLSKTEDRRGVFFLVE
jgi:hypothetical protein